VEYSSDLFDAGRISRMIEHFGRLLEAVVEDPGQRISILPLMPETEAKQVLIDWNATAQPRPAEATLARLFEAQVERTPQASALVAGDDRLTYRELNARANQLAHYLRSAGVGPESLVGIFMERSWRMMVGILGVLKAGGAYVPLDPAYPKDRLEFILEDTRAPVLLTQSSWGADGVPEGTRIICLDSDWNRISRSSRENPFSGPGSRRASRSNIAARSGWSVGRRKCSGPTNWPVCWRPRPFVSTCRCLKCSSR
jgi:non-ribosomal peptide synthetase component F